MILDAGEPQDADVKPANIHRPATGTRIVVADRVEARFYDYVPGGALRIVGRLSSSRARLRDRDLVSDRPGRVFNRAPPATGRRGTVMHHATDGERSPHQREAQAFARRIAGELESARCLHEFGNLVLISAPGFLGLLRQSLTRELRGISRIELRKDIMHLSDRLLGARVLGVARAAAAGSERGAAGR